MSWSIVADIGGTNMRVARVDAAGLTVLDTFAMTAQRDVAATLAGVIGGQAGTPGAILCAAAGPATEGAIRLTNGGQLVSERAIAAATGVGRVRVINDFEAAAWSLVTPEALDLLPLGTSSPVPGPGPRVAIGPGTGLGVGALVNDSTVLPGEGGHVGIGPRTARDVPVFDAFARQWPETRFGDTLCFEAEAMLSGKGLPRLYAAVRDACGLPPATLDAAEVFARAQAADDAAHRTVEIFRHQLAQLAGDLAVAFKARGGVFLLGGVAQANPRIFDADFAKTFRAGGRFTALRADCGIYLVRARDFGLIGAANALRADQPI